ncbi:MAG: 8-oxo-dGTP diphosphatase [Leptonema sp. (in: bacteria)]
MNLKEKPFILEIQKNFIFLTTLDKEIIFCSKSKNLTNFLEDFLIFLYNNKYYLKLRSTEPKEINPKNHYKFQILQNYKKNILNEIIAFKKNKIYSLYTLCFVMQNNKILLGKKKKGLGQGYFNGFGGKVEVNEKIEEAAVRELYEESGITAKKLIPVGKLFFNFSNSHNSIKGYVFLVEEYEGTPKETKEMIPVWFSLPEKTSIFNLSELYQSLPFKEMWEDDLFWFPYFLRKEYFLCFFELNAKNEISSMKIFLKDKK